MHEEKATEQQLRDRWIGEEERIQKIIESAKKGDDWTVHLEGLPYIDEIQPVFDEKYGRDLRGIYLGDTILDNADFRNTDLSFATLRGAKLDRASFSGANLTKANLSQIAAHEALFVSAKLIEANLSKADLKEAVLTLADLREANLSNVDLKGAAVDGVNLTKAELHDADLSEASLRDANFTGAQLDGASFRNSDLSDANLCETLGLMAGQLAGANVLNAVLPEDISKFNALDYVEKAATIARRVFLTIILGCSLAGLTLAGTTDLSLITNAISAPLPMVNTSAPSIAIFQVGPFVLFGVYIYFQLYMQRLWESLAELPAIFPDGRSLDRTIYPWLPLGFVRAHVPRLRAASPSLFGLQMLFPAFLMWLAVPFTLLFFWLRYLVRHDWNITCIHILLLVMSITFATGTIYLAAGTLRGKARNFSYIKIIPITIFMVLVLCLYSVAAINGILGYPSLAKAHLSSADISTKPPNWTGKEIDLVTGALLMRSNLRYCLASGAFLVKADLRASDLRGSRMDGADLRRAVLFDADLSGASLSGTDLRFADLRRVNLRGANFQYADLTNADLRFADLTNADLRFADLRFADLTNAKLLEADLRNADLRNAKLLRADLSNANLKDADLINANPWQADLSNADLSNADLSNAILLWADLRNANLEGADLTNANLTHANLRNADLSNADLRDANLLYADLSNADLRNADLTRTKGLTREQIESAIIDKNTKLPEYLEHLKEELLQAQKEREAAKEKAKGQKQKSP